jgi:hypothetical protein
VPSGADALASLGPGSKTPCSVADAGFSVTYTLNKLQPVTVPVQVAGHPQPLIAWTAPHGGLYAEPIMPRLRVAEP